MEAAMQVSGEWIPVDTFGARLAIVRQRLKWNVSEAARECGLKPATWKTWEELDTLPRDIFDVCTKISQRTGCRYEWLLMGGPLELPKDVRNRCDAPTALRVIPRLRNRTKRADRPLPLFVGVADNR